jgi:subtilase family serine protease
MLAIESIKEKLETEKRERLEEILKVSGSNAISKTEYNTTIVDEKNAASSLIFKNVSKDKFDNDELVKAIDIEITELKPNIPTQTTPKVDLDLYNEAVAQIEDLRKQVELLQNQVVSLNGTIANLNAQLESITNEKLSTDQINDALVNQLDTLSKTVDDFAVQIQTAVQKSVEESILRASLQAQNSGFKAQIEALIKQIDSLNSIIEGNKQIKGRLSVCPPESASTVISSAIGILAARLACNSLINPCSTNCFRIFVGAGWRNLVATSRREILAIILLLISI